ncbi:MAG: LPXTG cell wall anchor domain-containing protein [Lachnospiraceae bacterium]
MNTKLSALPSTGGIGTTIFTIAGCVIMIAAAGLILLQAAKTTNK